ncbi:MAG: hypothetical protein WEB53_02155 [Akkermansiaceae bacterium]
MMNSLRLSPLPSIRAEGDSDSRRFERDGFVDEAVVAAMACHREIGLRKVANLEDLVLAADDLDFAGWQLPAAVPVQNVARHTPMGIPLRRPAPPVVDEPGLGQPHSGSHRWWFAGLAGILSTMLFSLLLLTLATRQGSQFEPLLQLPTDSAPPAALHVTEPESTPDLAETSAAKPQ